MTKDIALKKEFHLANIELIEELRENLDGVEIDFPVIKIVHPSQRFEMPDGELVRAFRGVVLFHHNCNAYWEKSYDDSGGGSAPDCKSLDGISADMNSPSPQSEHCASCPMNAWGSGAMKNEKQAIGKACKNMKRVYVLCEGDLLPSCLIISPANKKAIDKFVTLITMKALLLRTVVISFTLKESSNQDGVKYSSPDLMHNLGGDSLCLLSYEQSDQVKAMRDTYMPLMKAWGTVDE